MHLKNRCRPAWAQALMLALALTFSLAACAPAPASPEITSVATAPTAPATPSPTPRASLALTPSPTPQPTPIPAFSIAPAEEYSFGSGPNATAYPVEAEEVWLNDSCGVTARDFAQLAAFTKLKTLALLTPVEQVPLGVLGELPELEKIVLVNVPGGLEGIGQCGTLRHLWLAFCDVGAMGQWARCPIEDLFMQECAGIRWEELSALGALKELRLRDMELGDMEPLIQHPTLKTLVFNIAYTDEINQAINEKTFTPASLNKYPVSGPEDICLGFLPAPLEQLRRFLGKEGAEIFVNFG